MTIFSISQMIMKQKKETTVINNNNLVMSIFILYFLICHLEADMSLWK